MKGRGSIVFPRRKPFTSKNLKEFINSYIRGDFEISTTAYDFDNKYIFLMPSVQHLDIHNFDRACLKEGKDTLLLLYDSLGDEEENNMAARFYEKTAARFKDLDIKSLRVVAYDIYQHSIPQALEFTQDLPQLIFFPAFHKSPPYRYFQDIRAEKLMKNVQESADIKFELPENYHLNEDELKRFQAGIPLEDL